MYQRIGSKPQVESVGKKRGRPHADDVAEYGEKKVKPSYQYCDMQKHPTKWMKLELQTYLCHHKLKKKSELIIRIKETHGKNQTLIVVQTHTNLFLMQVCVNRTGYETKAIEQSKTQVETMVHAHET